MLTWKEFSEARPDLAEAGRRLLYQWDVGLAFLGTVRKDGGPRSHPMCPVVSGDGLYGVIEPHGPKRYDLERDVDDPELCHLLAAPTTDAVAVAAGDDVPEAIPFGLARPAAPGREWRGPGEHGLRRAHEAGRSPLSAMGGRGPQVEPRPGGSHPNV